MTTTSRPETIHRYGNERGIVSAVAEDNEVVIRRLTANEVLIWSVRFSELTPAKVIGATFEAACREIGIGFTFNRRGDRVVVSIPA